jgi:hypothetical protein
MCDKLNIPFLKQEINISETLPLENIKIPYEDPTLLEKLTVLGFPNTGLKIDGKINLDVSGICDISQNRLEANGKLKLENIVSGPYETEGGIISFRRLFLHFKNLEIPIQIYYEYEKEKVCDPSYNLINGITGSTGGSENGSGLTGSERIMNRMKILFPTVDKIDISGNKDSSGNKDTSGNKDLSNNIVKRKPFEVNVFTDGSENTFQFDKFFVTNGISETNMNMIFNALESYFRDPKSIFTPVYQSYLSSLISTKLGVIIKQELNRILCLKYEDKTNNKSEDNIVNVYSNYKEKIERLKINQNYSVIFK